MAVDEFIFVPEIQPSSSARAAEQLANTGTSAQGFVGFGVLSDLGYVPASGTSDEADSRYIEPPQSAAQQSDLPGCTITDKVLKSEALVCSFLFVSVLMLTSDWSSENCPRRIQPQKSKLCRNWQSCAREKNLNR